MATMSDIAERAGVSRATVSYVLNNRRAGVRVSEATREQIQTIAEQLGYKQNRIAKALVTGRTQQIALCLPHLATSFFTEIISQLEILTRDEPFDLLITTLDSFLKDPDALVVDGMIVYSTLPAVAEVLPRNAVLLRPKLCQGLTEAEEAVDMILLDIDQASHDVMQLFLGQGCHNIVLAAPNYMIDEREPRYAIYDAAMREANLTPQIVSIPVKVERHTQHEAYLQLLRQFEINGAPEALFCSNDDVALGAYRAARAAGLSIPGDLQIIGCDDISEALALNPTLSSIRLPMQEACHAAWELLTRRINEPEKQAEKITVSGDLILRESSLQNVKGV